MSKKQKSQSFYKKEILLPPPNIIRPTRKGVITLKQKQLSTINKQGWSKAAYEAWTNRHGAPADYAKKLMQNPKHEVAHYLPYIGETRGQRIINLLGSKGNKAVAFALLGANVTVVDISESNAKYANELATACNVPLTYIVSDVLEMERTETFDFVLLELGVLHYFVDLQPLFRLVSTLLKDSGTFILRDYHPFSTKFVQNGNYFAGDIAEVDVAYSILLPEKERTSLPKNKIRRWTLGEIITEIAKANLHIKELTEEHGSHLRWAFPPSSPEGIEQKVPALYTLLAKK